MQKIQFSKMVNQFQPGIFTALNEKKEEMIRAGRKVFNLSRSALRISSRHLMS
ncbi:MAG: hypothetical protein ACLRMN_09120 [Mediterraneibacter gnavus]